MGTYINIGNAGFQSARNGEYVDKSLLIPEINATLDTEQRFSCVTRCRRFGKSMAAKMLNAYYDRSCDSRSLFADLKVAQAPSFEKHLNKYSTICLDMSDFVTRFGNDDIIARMNHEIIADVHEAFPNVPVQEGDDLMGYLIRVVRATDDRFFFIIDEWDAICREFMPRVQARHQGDGRVCEMVASDVQRRTIDAGVCRGLYDRHSAHQEIQDGVGTEQLHRVLDGDAEKHGIVFWLHQR